MNDEHQPTNEERPCPTNTRRRRRRHTNNFYVKKRRKNIRKIHNILATSLTFNILVAHAHTCARARTQRIRTIWHFAWTERCAMLCGADYCYCYYIFKMYYTLRLRLWESLAYFSFEFVFVCRRRRRRRLSCSNFRLLVFGFELCWNITIRRIVLSGQSHRRRRQQHQQKKPNETKRKEKKVKEITANSAWSIEESEINRSQRDQYH